MSEVGDRDARAAARAAGLSYTSDRGPGIRRRATRRGFAYADAGGRPVRDRATLERVRALAVPPAWTDVWICPSANGHLQATGRDSRGRKQYRYHKRWREVRDGDKYGRLIEFAKALPRLRRRYRRDMALPGLPKVKVVATVVCLLEESLIRVGNEEYSRANHSYGLTTLRERHARVRGARVRFQFRAKSGKEQAVEVEDPRVARVIRRLQELPGQALFQYIDDQGERHQVASDDVNAYLQEVTGMPFTAKDFRTWAGTVLCSRALREMEAADSEAQRKQNVIRAIERVAEKLGNTRAVCRKAYIHPAITDAYLEGALLDSVAQRAGAELKRRRVPADEAAVLEVLRRRPPARPDRARRAA